MKRFLGFVKKEFFHIFRDYRTLIILFGMPVVQILIFGFAITTDLKDARIAILDQSKDEVTQKLTAKILSSGYFVLQENLGSLDQVESSFRQGRIREVLIFEPDFSKKLEKEGSAGIQIITDASDPNTANLLVHYTTSIIMGFQQEYNQGQQPAKQITAEIKMQFNPEMKSVFMFIPGTITILLMLISAMMTSISITREKETGTMEVLLVSPLKPFQIVVGKVVPYIFLSFVISVVILLMGFFVFGMPVQGSVVLLLAESLLFIVMALSLGILISTVSNSQMVAMMASMVGLMLPTILLSGFIFPIENMPVVMQWLCQIIPARWFITIVKGIMLKGVGLAFLWKENLILVGMTCLFIALSIRNFKIRLE